MISWRKICILPDVKLKNVLEILNNEGSRIVFVLSENDELIGSISDGDVRRALLKGISLEDKIEKVVNRKCFFLPKTVSEETAEELIEQKSITHIPLMDEKQKVVSIFVGKNFQNYSAKINNVVVMAGGLGSRLGEITKEIPKPLVRIHNKPILEILVSNLKRHGFNKFYFSVNYLSEKIEEHFGNGEKVGVEILYIKETKRMGTAGSLTLLPKFEEAFLLTNADVLTKVNYEELLSHHKRFENDLTICCRKLTHTVPYGVLTLNGSNVIKITEKPTFEHYVSAGIYILNPEILSLMPKNTYFDMPSLINLLLEQKYKVGHFIDNNYWVDVGRLDDLEKARNDFSEVFE